MASTPACGGLGPRNGVLGVVELLPLDVAFLRTRPRMLVGTEPGGDALIHSPQKSTIHRFLMVRTIGRVLMKLLV